MIPCVQSAQWPRLGRFTQNTCFWVSSSFSSSFPSPSSIFFLTLQSMLTPRVATALTFYRAGNGNESQEWVWNFATFFWLKILIMANSPAIGMTRCSFVDFLFPWRHTIDSIKWHTPTTTHGLASIWRLRTAMSLRQWWQRLYNLVPRGCDPFGQRQGYEPLVESKKRTLLIG